MWEEFKKNWQRFKRSNPGERFKRHYYQRQRSTRSAFRKFTFSGIGILAFVAGLFFLVAPGPGITLLLIGSVLIAEESLLAARALDWTELQLRRGYTIRILLAIGVLGILTVLAFGVL